MAMISPSNLVALGYMSRCRTLAWEKWSNTWPRKW